MAEGFLPPDEQALRHVLGQFRTGVTVVTTWGGDGPAGLTCETFCSLSLDPPLVLFCVNVLAADQVELARRFARPGARRFAGVPFSRTPCGTAMLAGALAWIDCALETSQTHGDHAIAVGRVRHLRADPSKQPLPHWRGQVGHALGRARADAG